MGGGQPPKFFKPGTRYSSAGWIITKKRKKYDSVEMLN
jgi:hypothetical protein